jgi:hypothetical protein
VGVARVRLYLWEADPRHEYRFIRPDGSLGVIEGLRLRAFVRFLGRVDIRTKDGWDAAFPDCIVDTGALLTIIPERIWRHFLPGVVTRLPFHPSMPQQHRRLTIAGGTFPYELGELAIPLMDQEGGALDVTVVAKFTQDGGRLNVPLTLGLRGGFLDGGTLSAGPDATAAHGQSWTLTNP